MLNVFRNHYTAYRLYDASGAKMITGRIGKGRLSFFRDYFVLPEEMNFVFSAEEHPEFMAVFSTLIDIAFWVPVHELNYADVQVSTTKSGLHLPKQKIRLPE